MKPDLILAFLIFASQLQAQEITIGSKNFSESRLLCEIMAQAIEGETTIKVERKLGLGGTLICFEALKNGAIDLYPEYTGTIKSAIYEAEKDWKSALKADGIVPGPFFGFNNTYILVSRKELGLHKISDLQGRNDLRFGFSNEFIQRSDGFPGLSEVYQLGIETPRGMDHGLAYKALAEAEIDVTDAYSTDGKLEKFGFSLLEDDRGFFPDYQALPLIREEVLREYPEAIEALNRLKGKLNASTMRNLNYKVEVEKQPLAEVAEGFLLSLGMKANRDGGNPTHPILRQTLEHLRLTFLATFLGILIAVPLGICIAFKPKLSGAVLSTTGVIQTIPSLALLGFMIPLFGIGFWPAIVALFLYALLPIVRNTFTGLQETDPLLIEAGRGMGMTPWQILTQVRLPLAAPVIIAGILIALTINLGTATLAAFIGAGGLGESIITGITLNDNKIILQGAIPAALLALIADRGMAWVAKKFSPPQ
jgi:osmoprotectant transport system permease protein